MNAEVNIPDEAVNVGWHEFRYPRPAVDEPSAAFVRGLSAAAPAVLIDELTRISVALCQRQQEMREEDDRTIRSSGLGEAIMYLRNRIAELRGESR